MNEPLTHILSNKNCKQGVIDIDFIDPVKVKNEVR